MYLGIDIGGTKTLVASFDKHGSLLDSVKIPTPHDYREFLEKLKPIVDDLPDAPFQYCGIGMPGIIDRARGGSTWSGDNLGWKHHSIASDVSAIVNCPVIVENDANTAAIGEARFVQDTYQTALYVTLSTGIGSGFVVNGNLDPATLNAEVGHMIFPHGDDYRSWEQMASGGTIVKEYGQRADEITDPAIWEAISEQIAVGLINLTAALTPEVIILGGGVGAHLNRFKQYLDEQVKRLSLSGVHVPPILQAHYAEQSVIYGCYELAKQKLNET
jgi:predicted NBD/HSP70 family sugar kinase